MPDITLCSGGDCSQKETCYRFTAEADRMYQSFFAEMPNKGQEGDCDYYTEVRK